MNERREAAHPWALGLTLGVLTVALHLATAADSWDLFRDELYYLANADHLGFGYVDHPPLVGWLTALFRALLGSSKLAIRVWPALAAGGTVFAACGLARELGGRRWAELAAGVSTALAPGLLALFGFLSMNAADLLLWTLAFWAVARVLGRGESSAWVLLGLVAGLGLLTKLSMLFLLAGLVLGLAVTGGWRHLRSRNLWIGAALALALVSPYLVWQILHGWPTAEFMANASAGKIAPIGPVDFVLAQWAPMGWVAALLGVGGLAWLLIAPAARPWRALG
ncbi:MAG: glycosyltransferase family 39 protein [Thermoanaerobaculia bacterium]